MKIDFYAPLEADCFFHIYNRGNDGIKIFYNNGNYEYFLKKFDEYFSGYLHVYTYCLLANHFHFLVSIKNEKEVLKAAEKMKGIEKIKKNALENNYDLVAVLVSEQFRRFFIAYSKAINNQTGRHGSLFTKKFRRKKVNTLNYLQRLVFYIHTNPVHHELSNDFINYKWNTYRKILSSHKSKLMKKQVIEWFNDKENYAYMHKIKYDTGNISDIED